MPLWRNSGLAACRQPRQRPLFPNRTLWLISTGKSMPSPKRMFAFSDGMVHTGSLLVEIPLAVSDAHLSEINVITRVEWPQGLLIPGMVQSGLGAFPSSPLYGVFPDGSGVVTVTWDDRQSGAVKIQVHDSAGNREFEVAHAIRSIPVPGHVADSLVADGVEKVTPIAERRRERGLPVPSNLKKAVEDGLRIPRAFPAYQDVVAGVDGSIWLRRMTSFSDNTWVVLDSRGNPAFRVELPTGVNVQQAYFDKVWATALGEFDAPLILRFDIRPPEGRSPVQSLPSIQRGDR